MPRHNPAAAIEARQRREKFMQEFNALQALEVRQKLKVDWETKTEGKCKQQRLMRTLDTMEAEHHNHVEARRRRLAALLLEEEQKHEAMLNNLTETDSQRRERLIRKAHELRAKREEEKKLDNEARHDRLFREKIDVLRQAESRLKAMQMAEARNEQISNAALRKARENEEELYFAQQAREAQRLALERAQQDADLQYRRVQQNKADLQAQVRGNALRKAHEADMIKQEQEEFYRALHEDEVVAAQLAAQRRERQVKLGQEMKELNEELQRARKQEYEQLQAEDKVLMDKLLAELAQEEQDAQEAHKAHKAAMWNEFIDARQQLAQRKDDKDALDKLWEEANAAEWAKREAKWNAEQAARDALLRNVLIIRRQQVLDKRAMQRASAEERKREDEVWLQSLHGNGNGSEKEEDDDKIKERKRHWEQLQAYQRELDAQIAQRDAIRANDGQSKQTELSLQRHDDDAYFARIAQELSNLEAAKPAAFKHVPLLSQRDRQHIREHEHL